MMFVVRNAYQVVAVAGVVFRGRWEGGYEICEDPVNTVEGWVTVAEEKLRCYMRGNGVRK